jgi:tRNA U34 5-methylaminomethyl-2-thiouridine-forming methyltransferase MnmC
MNLAEAPAADIDWRGDVPVSRRFADAYFGAGDGLAEARHVFLAGSALPERFRPGFHIAELGFGTGLNALAARAAWIAAGQAGPLRYTAFEAWPLDPGAMARALAPWPELDPAPLLAAWAAGQRSIALDGLRLELVAGDARARVPAWEGMADAWFLDGFAPARNPELWEPELFAAVAARTSVGGTVATYSAAGGVRRTLAAAGFAVERVQGFGRKRHMTRGVSVR